MRDLLNNQYSTTGNDPLVAHLAQIRLLCNSQNLFTILKEEHELSDSVSKKLALEVSPFIEQALAFYQTSTNAPVSIKPVIQFYAYLNFASAIVRIYQPANWQSYKSHGVEDLSKARNRITINTKLLKIRDGVIPLFHSIFSDEHLKNQKFSLIELFSAIPMVSTELKQYFNQRVLFIRVNQSVEEIANRNLSTIRFKMDDNQDFPMPIRRIFKAIPLLRDNYYLHSVEGERIYYSKKGWSLNNKIRAQNFHTSNMLKVINYGSQVYNPYSEEVITGWYYNPCSRLLPVLSASLILSFCLSSIARYRANLLSKSENTRISSMFEVFVNESDYYMIPSFRNLLFGNTIHVTRIDYI